MARTFTQVPPDSTGDKLDMRSYSVGADVLHSQGVHFGGLPTFRATSANIVPANSKYHIYLLNQAASGQGIIILGLWYVNLQTGAVTGVVNQFDIRKATGATPTGGAAITPAPFNSADPALTGVTAYGGATGGVTDGTVLQSMVISSEEQTAAVGNFDRFTHGFPFLAPSQSSYGRPLVLRPGEGLGVKQNGAGTVGALQWIIDFAVELDT
jgi:hypothetical protein